MKKQIKISVADSESTTKDFVNAWKHVEKGEKVEVEERLTFEDLETLLRMLTSVRWTLLKKLRQKGPMSIRSLANELDRNYKNVHMNVRLLERMGLIDRTKEDKVKVPWDIVEARLRLAA